MNPGIMRKDLQLSLQRSGIDPMRLNQLQRILLTTDGTVTDVLEAYYREPMQVVVLAQEQMPAAEAVPLLSIDKGHELLTREILLQGAISGSCVLFASSLIVIDRLSAPLRDGLLLKQRPLGHLILEHRIETFREIVSCRREPAMALSKWFQLNDAAPLLCRTYTIATGGVPMMLVTEKFPEWGR